MPYAGGKVAGALSRPLCSPTLFTVKNTCIVPANQIRIEQTQNTTFIIIIIIIIITLLLLLLLLLLYLVTALFFLVLLLNQRWSAALRLPVSHCSTFRITCDVPSIAIFCGESIVCFLVYLAKFSLHRFFTMPVAPIITGILTHSLPAI